MRLFGIDYGRARIGVALGDTETKLASPFTVLERKNDEQAVQVLVDLAHTEGIETFVVGIPRPLADPSRITAQAEEIRRFAQLLAGAGFDVLEENETFSSKLAEKQVHERGEKGKRDDLAAMSILQGYLDRA